MVFSRGLYQATIYSDAQVERVHHLHCGALEVQAPHHFETLNRPVQGAPESHAEVGERWLHHHLERAGKTSEQLAETLYAKNWTIATEVRRVPDQ